MKPIEGYEGLYEISEEGVIRNLTNGNILHGNINSYGYRVIRLYKNSKPRDHKLHQLLAKAFIPNPNNYRCINHIDGDKLNNSLDNLERCNHTLNARHAREQLSIDFSRKPVVQSTFDGKLVAVWSSANIATHFLNGSEMMIAACCKGTAESAYDSKWKYLDRLLIE